MIYLGYARHKTNMTVFVILMVFFSHNDKYK